MFVACCSCAYRCYLMKLMVYKRLAEWLYNQPGKPLEQDSSLKVHHTAKPSLYAVDDNLTLTSTIHCRHWPCTTPHKSHNHAVRITHEEKISPAHQANLYSRSLAFM